MDRTQFTFYESFYKAAKRIKDPTARAEVYDAICEYALYGNEPDIDALSEMAAIAFELIKPNLDASRKKAESGKLGGRKKQSESNLEANESKTEAKRKQKEASEQQEQSVSKKENKIENKIENKMEKKSYNAALENAAAAPAEDSRLDTGLSDIIRRYEEDIGSFPRSALDSLQRWRQTLGDDLIALAIGEAAENNARSWRYIDRVLSSWQKEGVRTVGDVQARRERKSSPADTNPQYERLT